MSTETEAYIERLQYLRDQVSELLEGTSEHELNWTPLAEDTNSAIVLATHIAGSESHWVHQVAGGIDVHRNREAEFEVSASDPSEILALLRKTGQTTKEVLGNVSTADLDKAGGTGPSGAPVTGRWAVLHAIEHIGQHLGHLDLTKQLYAARGK